MTQNKQITFAEVETSVQIETKIVTKTEFSVTEVSSMLKKTVEDKFSHIRIRGEISGLKAAPSGHVYFSLKDQNSVLSSVCWKGVYNLLKIKPQDGTEVICIGSLTTFAGQSKYQLIVEHIELAGIGALMQMLADRKEKLQKEGLFAPERKKPIPFMPKIIGVVTSPTGAVIRDILHRLQERCPTHVIIWPVLVQGDKAAEQITNAIDGFNKLTENRPDLIIVARGGGSFEDLWCFNEENVVRATANSNIPIISAVGHETDVTLIDFASDKRAPTPTAAAEIAVPVRNDLLNIVHTFKQRLTNNCLKYLESKKNHILSLTRALPDYRTILLNFTQRTDDLLIRFNLTIDRYFKIKFMYVDRFFLKIKHPQHLINKNEQKLEFNQNRLNQVIERTIADKKHQYLLFDSLLKSYNYANTLQRGYVIVRDNNNKLIKSVDEAKKTTTMTIEFKDGTLAVKPQFSNQTQ